MAASIAFVRESRTGHAGEGRRRGRGRDRHGPRPPIIADTEPVHVGGFKGRCSWLMATRSRPRCAAFLVEGVVPLGWLALLFGDPERIGKTTFLRCMVGRRLARRSLSQRRETADHHGKVTDTSILALEEPADELVLEGVIPTRAVVALGQRSQQPARARRGRSCASRRRSGIERWASDWNRPYSGFTARSWLPSTRWRGSGRCRAT